MAEANPHIPMVPISIGELIDKITILRIKSARLQSLAALDNVHREMEALESIDVLSNDELQNNKVQQLTTELHTLNIRLWDVEDKLRVFEAKQRFDEVFITLARSVYQLNDERAAIKRQINETCRSTFVEEKSYGEANILPPS